MTKHNTILLKNKKITIIFLTGAILTIVGVALWVYTDGVIRAHKQALQNPNLTQQERWALEGSLRWWINAELTLYGPVAITLITAGIIALLYVILWAIIQPA